MAYPNDLLIEPENPSQEDTEAGTEEGQQQETGKKQKAGGNAGGNAIIFEAKVNCRSCEEKVRNAIAYYPGVESVCFEDRKVVIKGKVDAKKLFESASKHTNKLIKILQPPQKEEKKNDNKNNAGNNNNNAGNNSKKNKNGGNDTNTTTNNNNQKFNSEYVHAPQYFSDENPNSCVIF